MSAPVDVLAVMDDLLSPLSSLLDEEYEPLDAARAAVAELIEAAQKALDKGWEYGADEPHFVRLDAALARVGGTK